MEKDFDGWNKLKQETQNEQTRLYTVREIWWCKLGVNIGCEQDGKGDFYVRPCVVLKAFGKDACLVVPLTTSLREHAYRISVGVVNETDAKANISQMKTIDVRRLVRRVGFLDKQIFAELKKRIGEMFL